MKKETPPTPAKEQYKLPEKLTLYVTGSGYFQDEIESELLLRTDDATLHLHKGTEFGKLANALVDRYNSHSELAKALQDMIEQYGNFESGALLNAKQVLKEAGLTNE